MTTQRLSESKRTAISGWFRITVIAVVVCALFAAYLDDEGFLDRFGLYFVWVVLAIAAIRSIFYAVDWIACGFSHEQARKMVCQGKLLIGILAFALFLYLLLPLCRYSVISTPGSDSTGSPSHFIVLDRMTGEVHWLGHIDDRQRPRRQRI